MLEQKINERFDGELVESDNGQVVAEGSPVLATPAFAAAVATAAVGGYVAGRNAG
ncbi:hypothetical protein K378_02887 [Streptomyces sp. Amel2xB2]|uniref:hypothetical protein n=1 Tax=Streptomyces sp. Amel2xB2 TaxID=1305829 RepID=UPI000DBF40F8|nr:hypothetical protein [Streptomyces sp. Amel2xB2]RAJ66714.1 hypothetical protein K378_02887 [Streptomyces sp. Amel2xB2]